MKVQREATSCFAVLHQQIGPGMKALALSLSKQQSTKNRLQKCFDDNPFDASNLVNSWPKESIAFQNDVCQGQSHPSHRLALNVPKTNLLALLPDDIVSKLVSTYNNTRFAHRGTDLFSCVRRFIQSFRLRKRAKLLGRCGRKPWKRSSPPFRLAMGLSILINRK